MTVSVHNGQPENCVYKAVKCHCTEPSKLFSCVTSIYAKLKELSHYDSIGTKGMAQHRHDAVIFSCYECAVLCTLAPHRYDQPSAGARIWWQHWHHVLPGQRVWLRSLCAGSG